MLKVCPSCNVELPIESFSLNEKGKNGRYHKCKACKNIQQRIHYKETDVWSRSKDRQRESNLKRKYNLSLEQFDNLKTSQNNCCAICLQEVELNVDHCHRTNKIRGLLCMECNTGIGKLGDTLEGVLRAVEYLKRNDNGPS